MEYEYRSLPCNIRPDEKLWCVSGRDSRGGAGILEWCYDASDALNRFGMMHADKDRFSDLRYHKYLPV